VKDYYWFPKMRSHVKKMLKRCTKCQQTEGYQPEAENEEMKIDKQKQTPIRLAYAIARMTPWYKSDDTIGKDAEDLIEDDQALQKGRAVMGTIPK
jgi:Integrase zinc binding domain